MRSHPLELRGVQIAVRARGAVLHCEVQFLARLRDVSQPQVGDAQPEMEFMVVGVAIDLLANRSLAVLKSPSRMAASPRSKKWNAG